MWGWSLEKCEEYVRVHAGMELPDLLHPATDPFDEDNLPGIVVGYDSMPSWLFNFIDNPITAVSPILRDENFLRPPSALPPWSAAFRADIVHFKLKTGMDHAIQNEMHLFRRLRHEFEADMPAYKEETKTKLNKIRNKGTGRALLAAIAATGHRLQIMPFHGDSDNAYAHTSRLGRVRATAKGRRVNYRGPNNRILGTGVGADSVIDFSPWIDLDMPGGAPDEILFHELVHSSRAMKGVMDAVPLVGQPAVEFGRKGLKQIPGVYEGYENQEEYIAIVITNIYLSEKGQARLRANHSYGTMSLEEANNLLTNWRHASISPVKLMENFRESQRDFYDALTKLPGPPQGPRFNIVKQYELRRNYYLQQDKGAFVM